MKETDIKKSQHSVYALTYHVVFVTKYRRPVLTEEMGEYLKMLGTRLMEGYGGSLVELNTDRDHLRMLITLKPNQAPSTYICSLKTQFSKELHKHFGSEIALLLKGDALWTASYFVATTGGANIETVRKYIEDQRTDGHKRKYEKTNRYAKKRPWPGLG